MITVETAAAVNLRPSARHHHLVMLDRLENNQAMCVTEMTPPLPHLLPRQEDIRRIHGLEVTMPPILEVQDTTSPDDLETRIQQRRHFACVAHAK
jgi:hypothetical protein